MAHSLRIQFGDDHALQWNPRRWLTNVGLRLCLEKQSHGVWCGEQVMN